MEETREPELQIVEQVPLDYDPEDPNDVLALRLFGKVTPETRQKARNFNAVNMGE